MSRRLPTLMGIVGAAADPLHRTLGLSIPRVAERMPVARGMHLLGATFSRIGRIAASAALMDEAPGLAGLARGLARIDGPVPVAVSAAQAKRARRAERRLLNRARGEGSTGRPQTMTGWVPISDIMNLEIVQLTPEQLDAAAEFILGPTVDASRYASRRAYVPPNERFKSVVVRVDREEGEIDIETRLVGRQKKPRGERRRARRSA